MLCLPCFFGFSFFIQDNNQRMRGNDFRLRFCWRLILLFILGNINAAFSRLKYWCSIL